MVRSDWLLLFLGAAPDRPVDPVRVQKGLFLLAMEQVVPAAERYRFEPYLYGPMSREVYRDVRRLRDAGLIAEVPADSDRWRCLVPTPAGVRDALELERPTGTASPDSLSRVRAIRHEVDCMTFDELLRRVYTRYPEYAANSVFRR